MQPPPVDPAHGLLRLTPDEWLSAAVGEYDECVAGLLARQQRKGVAAARRAAGMALNAVLVLAPDEAFGRSYMDHLRTLGRDEALPEGLRHAARQLLEAPLEGPRFIRIGGGGDEGLAAAARAILEWCAARVDALQRSP
jgi:HEPN domain-containing protein